MEEGKSPPYDKAMELLNQDAKYAEYFGRMIDLGNEFGRSGWKWFEVRVPVEVLDWLVCDLCQDLDVGLVEVVGCDLRGTGLLNYRLPFPGDLKRALADFEKMKKKNA